MIKVKPFLQYSAVECGACSLASILRYYGFHQTIPELRELLGVNRDGSKAADILRGARSLGLESKGMKIPYEAFSEENFPCILFWEFNHFLVLEGFKDGRAYLSNPALGRHSVSIEEFKKSYSGVSMLFKPGPDFIKGGTKEPSLYQRIIGIPLAYPIVSLIILLISVVAVIPQLFIAGASAQFLNSFLGDNKAYMGMPIIIITLCAIVLSFATSLTSQTLIRRLQYVISKKMSINLFKVLFSSSFAYLGQRSGTELSTRMTMGLLYSQSVIGIFYSYLTIMIQTLIVTVFMFFISWELTLMTLIVIAVNLVVTYNLIQRRSDDNKKLAISSGKASSNGFLSLINIETIKATGLEPLTLDKWLDEYIPVVEQNQELGIAMNSIGTISRSSSMLLDLATLCYGAYLILNGNFTLGGLLAFQFLSGTIQAPLSSITSIGQALQSIDGIIGRLNDLNTADISPNAAALDNESLINSTYNNVQLDDFPETPVLTLNSIAYKFGTHLPNFFEDLSLSFPPGSHTTIVGTSGSGKSTLIKILAGLLDPCSGNVSLENNALADLVPSIRAHFISYVPQDIFLFESTFKNNITLWDSQISQDDVTSAARDSVILDKINSFPLSFDTTTTAFTTKLSGGQQQRLCIARALSRKPRILLLDEATSALDTTTEKDVLQNIYKLNITTISVAHRLYTALSGDYVIVLEQGKIVEQGDPNILIRSNGSFAQLVNDEQST